MRLSLPFVLLVALVAPTAAQAAAPERPYIVVYDRTTPAAAKATTADIVADEDIDTTQRFGTAVQGFAAKLSSSEVAELRDDPRVAAVTRDIPMQATGLVPVAGADAIPTGVRRTGAAVNTSVRETSSANVAVIDTGIELGHPDLNAVAGKDCTGSGTTNDGNGHGTHVAGTIGARNNGSGVVGIVPGTKLWSVRVLGSNGSGSMSNVICGIDWVTSTRKDTNTANDIAVANLSLGGSAPPNDNCGRTVGDALHMAICNGVAAGVTFVVAAGNSNADLANAAPANYPEVLTVTSVADADGLPGATGGRLACSGEADDNPAGYSNYATRAADIAHVIAAPGSCINSTWIGRGYRAISGTSMASPHVAGLAALCIGDGATRGPCFGKTPAQVVGILRKAASDQSTAVPSSGFLGDPTRPLAGRTYGYLASTRFSGTTAPAPAPATAPVNTAKPVISGAPVIGTAVTATTGTWSGAAPITYALQWQRCTTAVVTSCSLITGATAATYTPVAADQGRLLRVRVTARNSRGTVVVVSDPTAAVAARVVPAGPPVLRSTPTISGTPRPGARLTANPGTWDGTAPMTFTYYWAICRPGSNVCSWAGATGASFQVPNVPAGTRFVFVMIAQNRYGAVMAQSMVSGLSGLSSETPSVVGLPPGATGS